jgi:transposase
VDEQAVAKRPRYRTVVADDRKRESRLPAGLDGFWHTLTPAQRHGSQAMAMDLGEPSLRSTRTHLEAAERQIVFDKFHVAQHVHEAVDAVRKAEHRALQQAQDDRLTGTKYLWLLRPQAMSEAQRFFARWFWRATHSRLKPVAPPAAGLIQRHLPNLLTYLRHRLTNAGLEAVNATLPWGKKTAQGYRNVEHFKTAIDFHCGGLDLYPH